MLKMGEASCIPPSKLLFPPGNVNALLKIGSFLLSFKELVPKEPVPKSKASAGWQHLDRGLLAQALVKLHTKVPFHKLKSSFWTIHLPLAASHHLSVTTSGCPRGRTPPSSQRWGQMEARNAPLPRELKKRPQLTQDTTLTLFNVCQANLPPVHHLRTRVHLSTGKQASGK